MSIISVIVPVYKVEPYICRCVDSILSQTFTQFELVLVDDGSPDRCGIICDEYAKKDKRVRVIHQKNGGLSSARNAGLDWVETHSQSEWITFIDSDDWVHRYYLEWLLCAATQMKCQISACNFKRSEEYRIDSMLENNLLIHVEESDVFFTQNGNGIIAYAWGRLYKKNLWKNIRFPTGKKWEDIAIAYKLILAVPEIAVVDNKLYYYYINGNSIVQQKWTPERLYILQCYEEQMSRFPLRKFPLVYSTLAKSYLTSMCSQVSELKETVEYGKINDYIRYYLLKFKAKKNIVKLFRVAGCTYDEDSWMLYLIFPKYMALKEFLSKRKRRE